MKERWKGLWKESEKIWNRWEGCGKNWWSFWRVLGLNALYLLRTDGQNEVNYIKKGVSWLDWLEGLLWFCQNGFYCPVLKHGPRSLPYMRVCELRNSYAEWKWKVCTARFNIDRPGTKGLSMSISGRTRKMVNYAWIGWSQEKSWWRLEAVLTCKLLVKFGYRGERLIEPSSSWFPLKFPSG